MSIVLFAALFAPIVIAAAVCGHLLQNETKDRIIPKPDDGATASEDYERPP